MGRVERDREIARRRKRRDKIKRLRARFDAAQTQADKDLIFLKARRQSPFVVFEESGS